MVHTLRFCLPFACAPPPAPYPDALPLGVAFPPATKPEEAATDGCIASSLHKPSNIDVSCMLCYMDLVHFPRTLLYVLTGMHDVCCTNT